jgi:YARHG domain-containing protein
MQHRLKAPMMALLPDIRRMMIGASVVAVAAVVTTSYASAQSCQALWTERNSYYKNAGYCFKTTRAISYFGNAGCMYDSEASVPLSRGILARIAEITRIERMLGCN